MLSRSLITAFILEVVLISALLIWLVELRWDNAVLLSIAVIVFMRILIALLSFIAAWIFRAPPPAGLSISPRQFFRLLGRESVAVTRLFFGLHPFAPWVDRPDPEEGEVKGLPILLVHGFFSNAGFWWDIKRWLKRQGISNLYTVNLEPLFGDLEIMAEVLDKRIREVLIRSGAEQLIIVAHSMGGLVGRAYLARHGGDRVRRLITLGSPHNGTLLARLLPGRNLAQMRPGNRWLTRLNDSQRGGAPAPVVSIFSFQDNIIVPQDGSELLAASNIPIAGVGHLEMAFSPRIKELLLQQIQSTGTL